MTATDNTFIHIGSRKTGVFALSRNEFMRPAPLIPLGETAIPATAVFQTVKNGATIMVDRREPPVAPDRKGGRS